MLRPSGTEASSTAGTSIGARPSVPRSVEAMLDACNYLDVRLRGRLPWLGGAIALVAGSVGPLVAARAGEAAPGVHRAVAITAAALMLSGLGWLARCRTVGGRFRYERAGQRIRTALALSAIDLRGFPSAPKRLRLAAASRLMLGAGYAGLLSSSALGVAELLLGQPLGAPLAGLSLASAALLGGGQLCRWALALQSARHALPRGDLALATREYPAVIDLSAPAELESVFIDLTLLHRTVEALTRFDGAGGWTSIDGHAGALERHLWRCMPDTHIERRRWFGADGGSLVADLVLDDAVIVHIERGSETSDAEYMAERARRTQRAADGRPVLVVVCGDDRQRLARVTEPALTALHEELPVVFAVAR